MFFCRLLIHNECDVVEDLFWGLVEPTSLPLLNRTIEASAFKDRFPKAELVTYRYYVGRKYMFDNCFKEAEEYLRSEIHLFIADADKDLYLPYLLLGEYR
jgi:hypothetical protein